MPRPAEQYGAMRARTEERIRAAAVSLFARHGFAATGIRDVARAAGISTGLVYRHHASKEDLFDALVGEATDGLDAVVDRLHDGDALQEFTREVVAAIARDDRFAEFLLLMNQAFAVPGPPPRTAELAQRHRILLDVLAGLATGDGDPRQRGVTYLAALSGLAAMRIALGDALPVPEPGLISGILVGPGSVADPAISVPRE